MFLTQWKVAAQSYRTQRALPDHRAAVFDIVDGLMGGKETAGMGRYKVSKDELAQFNDNKEDVKKEEGKTKLSRNSSLAGGKKNKNICFCLPPYKKWPCAKKSMEEGMFEVYSDYEGRLVKAMETLHVDEDERDYWVRLWMEIDEDHNNEMSYGEFVDYFSFSKDPWINRVFLMINKTGNGVATLAEFITFCTQYLILDKFQTEEFAFRLMSTRSSTAFNPAWSCLTMDDVRNFVTERYKPKSVGRRNKMALKIFKKMDQDGDGGLDAGEWHEFCETNSAFSRFAHNILHHMRKCILGQAFWVDRSRKIRFARKDLGIMLSESRCNREAEEWVNGLLNEDELPVLDKKGKPQNNKIIGPGKEENPFFKSTRPSLRYHGALNSKFIPVKSFQDDMSDIYAAIEAEKLAKRVAFRELQKKAAQMSNRAHDLMREACADLIHGRRPLRQAWAKWCANTGIDARPPLKVAEEEVEINPETDDFDDDGTPRLDEFGDMHIKIVGVTQMRKEKAGDAAFENYLLAYSQEHIHHATKVGYDRSATSKALHGPHGPVDMHALHAKHAQLHRE